jgi:uncharacterized protein YneF (UPF0154 family)
MSELFVLGSIVIIVVAPFVFVGSYLTIRLTLNYLRDKGIIK